MLCSSYLLQNSQLVFEEIKQQVQLIKKWGELWQVDFAKEKTQEMVISLFLAAVQAAEGCFHLGHTTLPLQDHIKIFGVKVDRHSKNVSHKSSPRVYVLRRVARYLDARE